MVRLFRAHVKTQEYEPEQVSWQRNCLLNQALKIIDLLVLSRRTRRQIAVGGEALHGYPHQAIRCEFALEFDR